MNDLYEGVQLNAEQTTWICRGLLDLAAVDGVHENEVALIRQFFVSSGGSESELEQLRGEAFNLDAAAQIITGGVIDAFLTSCYLLIYADGYHSDEEKVRIKTYADALGVSDAQLNEVHLKARGFLLQELAAGLRNRDALTEVGVELGLTDDDINTVIQ
ncbi:MAG: hypothetical protein VX589_12515 [Myxococcota bacterium]|nr:hypothetical protein [Myxococcota bacterium]